MESTQPIDYHIMAILTFMVPFMPSILILFGIIGSFNRLYTRILETNNCTFLLFLAMFDKIMTLSILRGPLGKSLQPIGNEQFTTSEIKSLTFKNYDKN